jgi:hypothetical protein
MIRDLTKSMLSFSWAMSLFGIEQLTNTLIPQSPSQPNHRATTAFNAVTHAAEEQLSGMLKGVFKAGDQLQRGMVDLMLGFLSLEAANPSQIMRTTSDMMRQTTGAFGQGFQNTPPGPQPQTGRGPMSSPSTPGPQPQAGWGPIPPPGAAGPQPQTGRGPMSSPSTPGPQPQAGWGPIPPPSASGPQRRGGNGPR